jgi:maltose O-acetyltransferase
MEQKGNSPYIAARSRRENLVEFVRQFYWDISSAVTRDQYIVYFISDLPGGLGIAIRRAWYSKRFKECGTNLEVSEGSVILNPQNIECGDDVSIGRFSYIQAGGGIVLGSDVLLGPYVKIWTQNHDYEDYDKSIRAQGYVYKPVELGRDVWVGANTFILPGVMIGAKSIIAGSSVVTPNTYPEGCILAGHPARKIGERKSSPKRTQRMVMSGG